MAEVFEKIIEKLKEYESNNLIEHDSEMANHCKQDCNDINDCTLCVFDKAIEIVKQASEEFGTDTNVGSNGWISCSERLPENVDHLADGDKKKQYIVMTRNGRYEVAEWLEVYDKPFWCGHYSQEIKDVIRWKPLEPYEAKEE